MRPLSSEALMLVNADSEANALSTESQSSSVSVTGSHILHLREVDEHVPFAHELSCWVRPRRRAPAFTWAHRLQDAAHPVPGHGRLAGPRSSRISRPLRTLFARGSDKLFDVGLENARERCNTADYFGYA